MFIRSIFALTAAVLALAMSERAAAAPQVLAVLSSSSGIPFICDDGQCRAELSTYCLQQDRDPPMTGEAYLPARAGDFALVITGRDGVRRRLPVTENVRFIGSRGFMAAAALIPAKFLKGAASAAITIAENASLVPVPVTGDDFPLTDEEITKATGSLRRFGAKIVDRTENAAAARVLMRLSSRFSRIDDYRSKQLAGLWRGVSAEMKDEALHDVSLRQARHSYDACVAAAKIPLPVPRYTPSIDHVSSDVEFASSMLRCLQRSHDSVIRDANVTYWKGLAGS